MNPLHFLSIPVLIGVASLAASTKHHAPRNNSCINTTSGLVEGHPAPSRSSVTEYLGIRYAHAATGDLRFAAPKAFTCNDYFNASQYSPDCPTNIPPMIHWPGLTKQGSTILENFLSQSPNLTFSEDCLSLNIWTKGLSSHPKAVLIFMHGGRFQFPGSATPFYNGRYLADAEDIVVVSFNYRLAFLGFPGVTPNLGLLDFRLVIEWVRDNIAGFGGDPTRITIWGQSSGGVAVDEYAFRYQHDPIVHGLIADSGMAFNLTSVYPGEQEAFFLDVSRAAGCPNEVPSALSCLRQKPFKEILAAVKTVHPTHDYQSTPLAPFRPTIDNETFPPDIASLSREGCFAPLPLLAGGVAHESGFYRIASGANMTNYEWRQWESHTSLCPLLYQAHYRAAYGVPTWAWRYFGDWPNLRLYPGSGAYHGTELTMVFGTTEDVNGGVPNTIEEDKMTKYMMQVWAAFARDPHKGLEKLEWPRFGCDTMADAMVARLGFNNSAIPSFVTASEFDEFCPSLDDPRPDYGYPPFR